MSDDRFNIVVCAIAFLLLFGIAALVGADKRDVLAIRELQGDDGYCKSCDGDTCTAGKECVATSNYPLQQPAKEQE